MARAPKNELAMTDLHRAVTKLAKKQPASIREIVRWTMRNYDFDVNHETIRRVLIGECDPTSCSIELLVVLMGFYGVGPEALGQFAERRLGGVMAALGGDGGTPPGTRTQNLRVLGAAPLVGTREVTDELAAA